MSALLKNCRSCNHAVNENFCSNCGQPTLLKRIDSHYIIHQIQHLLHFEKGILYTIKELLIRPGKNVRTFISENRSRLVQPVLFIIVSSLIYTVVNHFFHIEEGYVTYDNIKSSATTAMLNWVQHQYGYANIIMGIFITSWLKLFFRKSNYNFFEILILLCFVMGMGMLLLAVAAMIQGLTRLTITPLAGVIFIAYCTWAIGQFFGKGKAVNYIKALAAYLLGMISFFVSVLILGGLVDWIVNQYFA